jgi:hypothetical protein
MLKRVSPGGITARAFFVSRTVIRSNALARRRIAPGGDGHV